MKKILIAEDDPTIADIYATEIRDAGYDVETQTDGLEALNRISASRMDAVLLDLDLPTLQGGEIIQRVRAQAHLQKLPIIVLTNAYDYKAVVQAQKAGASRCLIKANTLPIRVVQVIGELLTPESKPRSAPLQPSAAPLPSTLTRVAFSQSDTAFHGKVAKVFARESVRLLADMRTLWQQFLSRHLPEEQLPLLGQVLVKLHTLTGLAGVAECLQLADLSSALEALIKEVCKNSKNLNLSTLRTVGFTIDFIAFLVDRADKPWPAQARPAQVLVVDDELIACNTAAAALELVTIKATITDDPATALNLLEANPYDLILLDVDMPGMSGFELCGRLRALPAHTRTAVIFVTGMGSFENRAQSTQCGGNDLIGKPFLLIELAVKSLTYLLRAQLRC